ncbi:MAG: DUF2075 domain-containing protein [Staphylococcus equorum]|uniref:DNA/RNA helicase domain-containing protein n=1 Tax=Tetragenococcus halophilus TaxID=51669 RepID=UPI0026518D76|nr:DUF2075 domain-containing protein [Staphylococcus equorum]
MGKPVNLYSFLEIMNLFKTTKDSQLIDAMRRLCDDNILHDAENFFSVEELYDFYHLAQKLVNCLDDSGFRKADNFFLGYSVPIGISRQFDVLRFSKQTIVNIELKDSMPPERLEGICDQLKKNQFFLKTLNKQVISYTYVDDINKIYQLKDGDRLVESQVENLAQSIPFESSDKNELDSQRLNHFVISPYSEAERFASHKYFLNDHQLTKKNEIGKNLQSNRIGIIGGAGTGKSLLLFDLARTLKEDGEKVLVIFVGQLDNYKTVSELLNFEVIPIRCISTIENIESNYDTILVDEAQRLMTEQYDFLLSLKSKIVLSVDHPQTLHPCEDSRNIEGKIKKDNTFKVTELEQKVRTDREMADFISKLMNLSARNILPHDYNNVSLNYFNTKETARKFIDNKVIYDDWTCIEFTEYRTKSFNNKKKPMISNCSISTHEAVGKEYNKVIVVIDRLVERNIDGKLAYHSSEESFYPYLEMRLLFEELTRVKQELMIVIIENPKMYVDIQKNLLSWKKDQLAEVKTYAQERNYESWDDAFKNLGITLPDGTPCKAAKVEYIEKKDKVKVSYVLDS